MKVKSTLVLLIAIILFIFPNFAHAGDVRGRLDIRGPYDLYPAAYVPVTLYSLRARKRSKTVYTGSDGMYYFYNVPEGDHMLEVWVRGFRGKPDAYRIKVPLYGGTDIKPILVPY